MLGVAHGPVQVHLRERQLALHEVVAGHQHPGYPEKQDLRRGDQCVARVEAREVRRLLRPAERRERPEPRREPGVEHVRILLHRPAALGARRRVLPVGPLVAALGAGEHRDAVAPPQLPGNVPVPDVLHPVLERRVPALRDDLEALLAVLREDRLSERLHLHEPLIAEPRLDDRVAAITMAHRMRVRLDLLEQPLLLEHLDNLFARLEPVEPTEGRGDPFPFSLPRLFPHGAVFPHDERHLELVARADLEVVGVVRRRHLHEPRSEGRVHGVVPDDRDR